MGVIVIFLECVWLELVDPFRTIHDYFFHVRERRVIEEEDVAVVEVLSHSRSGFVSTLTDVPRSWVTATSCTSRLDPPMIRSDSILMRVSTWGWFHHSVSVSTQRVTVVGPLGPVDEGVNVN